ncbi:MAG: dihydroorotase [Spirochaetaceae bacterium]|jgi:dihydroorotase|nr:dihydroorotase [Spirochaetaceae bacterium]
MKKIEIIKPDDFHIHLRQGEILKSSVRDCSPYFSRVLVMPNTIPPIASVRTLKSYEKEIRNLPGKMIPLMTFKLLKSLKTDEIKAMKNAGAVAGKFYPAGSTTNSDDGITNWREIKDLLSIMSELGLILSIHGEDPLVFSLEREKAFIPQILEIAREFPQLKIVFEHLSSKEGVEAVEKGSDNLAGTITVQHLLMTLDDVIGGSLDPHSFCKPVLKGPEDKKAIQRVVLDGNCKFFFGSDSAPHTIGNKEKGSAGCYTSPIALPLLVQFFDESNKLDLLENFVSRYGADFYGLPYNKEKITLVNKNWIVPDEYSGIKPIFSGKKINWDIG